MLCTESKRKHYSAYIVVFTNITEKITGSFESKSKSLQDDHIHGTHAERKQQFAIPATEGVGVGGGGAGGADIS